MGLSSTGHGAEGLMLPPTPVGLWPGRALPYSSLRELCEVSSGAATAVGSGGLGASVGHSSPLRLSRPLIPGWAAGPQPPALLPGSLPSALWRPGPTASPWAPSCAPGGAAPLAPSLLPSASLGHVQGLSKEQAHLGSAQRHEAAAAAPCARGQGLSGPLPAAPGQCYLGPTVSPRAGAAVPSPLCVRGAPPAPGPLYRDALYIL